MKIALVTTLVDEGKGFVKHGIGMISSCLKLKGHEVDIYHEYIFGRDYSEYNIVGISCITSTINSAKKIAIDIKSKNPNIITVVGGPGATLSPEFLMDCNSIDYIFKGEGEITFPNVVESLIVNPEDRIIRGEPVTDINSMPFVDRSGYEYGESHHILLSHYRPAPMFSMFNSRWCRKNCKFCAPAMKKLYGGVKKLRTIDNFIQELNTLPTDYMTLFMHDDNFLENTDWCLELYEYFKSHDLYIPFAFQSYAPEIVKHASILEKLTEIGAEGTLVGYENANDRILKEMRKGSTRDINIEASRILNELGIKQQANLMYGWPSETLEEMMNTTEFYNSYVYVPHQTIPCPSVVTPAPGSDLYEELKENNLITISDVCNFERNSNSSNKINGVNYEDVNLAISKLTPFDGF